jgi:hypothetical protein
MSFENQRVNKQLLQSFLSEYDDSFFGAVNCGFSKQRISVPSISCAKRLSATILSYRSHKTMEIDQQYV